MGTVQAMRLSDAGWCVVVVAIERQQDGELAVVVTVMK
jgi:hypothetical protein